MSICNVSYSMDPQRVRMLDACNRGLHHELAGMLDDANVRQLWPGQLSLLHVAAGCSHAACAAVLLAAGADPDGRTTHGETPAFLAAGQGCCEVVLALRRAGADLDLSNNRGDTPLHAAISAGHFACARQLLWMGARCDMRNVYGLRAEDMMPTLLQPRDLIELLRVSRLRSRD